MKTFDGYIKRFLGDTYVLLAGGGHKALSDFATSGHNHDGRYIRWSNGTADTNAMSWGTLTSANGYTILAHCSSPGSGDMGWVYKGGQIFYQLDGCVYLNEGRYRCLDTSDSSSFAAASHTHYWANISTSSTSSTATTPLFGSVGINTAVDSSYKLKVNGDTYGSGYISADRFIARRSTSSHIAGFTGAGVALSMTADAGYNMALRIKGTDGAYSEGVYNHSWDLLYNTDDNIKANTNNLTYAISLLNDLGLTHLRTVTIDGENHTNSTTKATAALNVTYDNCSYDDDALVYFRNRGNNDWTVIVDQTGYDYGIDVRGASAADYLLRILGGGSEKWRATGKGAIRFNGLDRYFGINFLDAIFYGGLDNLALIRSSSNTLRFGGTSWNWNQWAGLKYNYSTKSIYLGIPDGNIFKANNVQSFGRLYTPRVHYLEMGVENVGHVHNYKRVQTCTPVAEHLTSGAYFKIAEVTDYFNFDIIISGGWDTGSPSIVRVNISLRNGTPTITQLSGFPGLLTSAIRLGQTATDTWNVLVYFTGYNTGNRASLRYTFEGTGGITVFLPTAADTTTYTKTVDLTLGTVSGISLTSSNYTSYTVTKTGSGASGSWGINITGSSASCTGNAAGITGYTFKTLSSKSHSGWANTTTDDKIITTQSFIAYWNGAYNSSGNSNLSYCNLGAFGSATTHAHSDYVTGLSISGNTLAWSKGGTAQTALTIPYATNADTVDGWHLTDFTETITLRDFTSGTLVKTSITWPAANQIVYNAFLLEVKGNGYGGGLINFMAQGYVYYDSGYAHPTVVNSAFITIVPGCVSELHLLSIDNKLCFWWPRMSYWQGFNITCKKVDTDTKNRVTLVLNSALPSASYDQTLTPVYTITSSNIGSQSVNYANSAGNAATATTWQTARTLTIGSTGKSVNGSADVSWSLSDIGAAPASHTHTTIVGSYTSNGGLQGPGYFGKNRVGALMMNTTINGNTLYKDFLFMDCYSGGDVGGGVAIGVNRQSLGAYIMRSEANRTTWKESAELIGTHNYTTYCAPASHTHSQYLLRLGNKDSGQLIIYSTEHSSGTVYGGGIQIREKGAVTTSQTAWEYAPRITFHWGGRYVRDFGMNSSGNLCVCNTEISLKGHTHTKANITDFPTSLPASDVYDWAKASTKPSYTYSEVGAAPASHNHNSAYVSALGTNGDYLTWTKNGTTNNITIPYASSADRIATKFKFYTDSISDTRYILLSEGVHSSVWDGTFYTMRFTGREGLWSGTLYVGYRTTSTPETVSATAHWNSLSILSWAPNVIITSSYDSSARSNTVRVYLKLASAHKYTSVSVIESSGNVTYGTGTLLTSMQGEIIATSSIVANPAYDSSVSGGGNTCGSSLTVKINGTVRTLTIPSNSDSTTKVIVNLHTTNNTNYPLVWSNENNSETKTSNQLYKSWNHLYYNPANLKLTSGRIFIGTDHSAISYDSPLLIRNNSDNFIVTTRTGIRTWGLGLDDSGHLFIRDLDGGVTKLRIEAGTTNAWLASNPQPLANNGYSLGSPKYEWGSGYIRLVNTRYLDASANYPDDTNLYIGYGATSKTSNTCIYASWLDANGTLNRARLGTFSKDFALNLSPNINARPAIAFRDGGTYNTSIAYHTSGNEALSFITLLAVTSFIFYNGANYSSGSDHWYGLINGILIKNNCLAINSGWAQGVTPDFRLKVGGNIYTSNNIYIETGDNDRFIMFRYNSNNYAGASWRIISYGSGSGDANYFSIQTGGSTPSKDTWYNVILMSMDNRRVCIGGETPVEKLDVRGNGIFNSLLRIWGPEVEDDSKGLYILASDKAHRAYVTWHGDTSETSFLRVGTAYGDIFLDAAQKVRTGNPIETTYKSGSWVKSLTESAITLTDKDNSYGGWICGPTKDGRIAISTYLASNNCIYIGYGERGRTANSFAKRMYWNGIDGNLYNDGNYYSSSDVRYKDIKKYLDVTLEALASIPLFYYTWVNKNEDGLLRVGSSSQAVLEIIPELVGYNESEDFYSLDYATLGTISGITACKELTKQEREILELKQRVQELEEKLANINNC